MKTRKVMSPLILGSFVFASCTAEADRDFFRFTRARAQKAESAEGPKRSWFKFKKSEPVAVPKAELVVDPTPRPRARQKASVTRKPAVVSKPVSRPAPKAVAAAPKVQPKSEPAAPAVVPLASAGSVSRPYGIENVAGDSESSCLRVPRNVRALVFNEFYAYAISRNGNVSDADLLAFSQRTGRIMAVKLGAGKKGRWEGESSGDTANVAWHGDGVENAVANDHKFDESVGHFFYKHSKTGRMVTPKKFDSMDPKAWAVESRSTLDRWSKIFTKSLPHAKHVDKGLNSGLLNISSDQLSMTGKPTMNFIESLNGRFGNVARATSMQGFMNIGAVNRSYFTAYQELARKDPKRAVLECGSDLMFADPMQDLVAEMRTLADDSCTPCGMKGDRISCADEEQVKCFVKWNTLCPALDVNIGMTVSNAYYGTRELDTVAYDKNGLPRGEGTNPAATGRCHQTLKSVLGDAKKYVASLGGSNIKSASRAPASCDVAAQPSEAGAVEKSYDLFKPISKSIADRMM